jgi:hypothetical protein
MSSLRFTVNGFITTGTPLAGYARATRRERSRALKGISFLRTWCKDKGKGIGVTDQLLLIRNVSLNRDGCLCKATRELAAALKFAHHVRAGGEETAS